MVRKIFLASSMLAAAVVAAPASATLLPNGSSGLLFSPFVPATQGTLLATDTDSGQAFTFAATLRSAVYRNTLGTLDFYFQVARTGPGSLNDNQIFRLTNSDFTGFTVDALVSASDPDGGGFFTGSTNGASTTTVGRSPDGDVLQTNFGLNGLEGTETSAVYIFRTNAEAYRSGTFGIIDGSTLSGLTFAPGPIPEPAAWAMMISGFGLVGGAMRRRVTKVAFAA